jgi:hypothetical protein
MMTADLPEDYETNIRVITFKEDHENWHQRKIKTKTIGIKKKWVEALDTDYSYDGILTLTDAQKGLKKKNDNAWNYLVMAFGGKPFDIITSEMESNTFQGWELLKEEYEPSTDKALISIQEIL